MEPVILAIIFAVPVIAIFTYAIYHFGYFIYHWHRTLSNVTNKYAPVIGPFLLISKNNFNKTGQESIGKAMYHFRRLLFSVMLFVVLSGIGAIIKNNANWI